MNNLERSNENMTSIKQLIEIAKDSNLRHVSYKLR